MTGTIRDWSINYGFIACDDGGDIFFCGASCRSGQRYRQFRAGDRVTFTLITDRGRTRADSLHWTAGTEPSRAELDRRAARTPEWREKKR